MYKNLTGLPSPRGVKLYTARTALFLLLISVVFPFLLISIFFPFEDWTV